MLIIIKIFALIFLLNITNLNAAMHTQELHKLQKAQQETKQSQVSEKLTKTPALIGSMKSINEAVDKRTESVAAPLKMAAKEKEIKKLEEAVKKNEALLNKTKTKEGKEAAQKRLEEAKEREFQAKEQLKDLSDIEQKKGTAYERYNVKQEIKRDEKGQRTADIEARKNEIKDFEKEITANEKMLKSAKTDAERKEAKERLADLQELVAQTKKERDALLKKQTFVEKIEKAATSHDKLLYGGTIAAVGAGSLGIVGAIGGSLALKGSATEQLAEQQAGEAPSAQQTDEEGRVEVTIE